MKPDFNKILNKINSWSSCLFIYVYILGWRDSLETHFDVKSVSNL